MTGLERLKRAAADPNQPVWRLYEYASERSVAPVVARNPSIDLPLVMKLAEEYPEAVAENPGLLLNAVVYPNFLKTLDEGFREGGHQFKPVLELLVVYAHCPPAVVDYAIANPRPALYRALLNNPALTSEQLLQMEATARARRMSGVRIRDIRRHMNHPRSVSGDPLKTLLDNFEESRPTIQALRKAVGSGNLHPDVQRCLINYDPVPLLPHCHDAQLAEEASVHDSVHMREAAAAAPALSLEGVRLLADDPHERVRQEVATRHDLPVDVATALARDEDPTTRRMLARNVHAPLEALDILVEDTNSWNYLAANPAAQEHHLDRITQDVALAGKRSAIYAACAHENLSAAAIRRIYQTDPSEQILAVLAKNPNTPAELLADLVKCERNTVRSGVADNPSTPLDLLEELRDDPDPAVRHRLTRRAHLPSSWLEAYTTDPNPLVQNSAEYRLKRDKQADPRLEPDPDRYENLIGEPDRPLMACVRNLKGSTYEMLAADKNMFTRLGLALNPSIPTTVVEKLANDPVRIVREALAKRDEPA